MNEQLTEAQAQALWDAEAAGVEPPAEVSDDNPKPAESAETQPASTGEQAAAADPDANTGAAETAQSAQPVDDPYAGLSPLVRAQLEKIAQIEQQNAALQQSLKTAEGRVSAMQREMDLAKKAKAQTGGDTPSDSQIQNASVSLEKWEKLKADFPDWAEGMEELVASRMGKTAAATPEVNLEEVAGVVFEQTEKLREQMARELEIAKVELKYENWEDEVKTDDFKAWMAVQTPEVKALAASEKAKDATKMLDLYYGSKAKPVSSIKEERNARLQAAVTQKGATPPAPKSVEDMTPEELWDYEARQIEKRGTY